MDKPKPVVLKVWPQEQQQQWRVTWGLVRNAESQAHSPSKIETGAGPSQLCLNRFDELHLGNHESEQTPGDGESQGCWACCSPWGGKESYTT